MKDGKVTIYTLTNPITNEVFYVGKTSAKLDSRLHGHLSERNNSFPKSVYIYNLFETHKVKPLIDAIDECDFSDGNKLELFWIEQFRSWGFTLYNSVGNLSNPEIERIDSSESTKVILLRITNKDTYKKLEDEAKRRRWSVNTLINFILEEYFKNNPQT